MLAPAYERGTPSAVSEGALLETYFEVIPFDIYVIDVLTYDIVYVNNLMRKRLLPDTSGTTKCYKRIFQLDRPCSFCKIKKLVTPDSLPNMQTHIFEFYDEAHECWYQMHEKAISWPDGRTVKYAIGVDISGLKDMQSRLAEAHAKMALLNKELQKHNEILQENIRLREDVERMTKHDLKTPLSAIIALPQVLLDDFPELPEFAAEALRVIAEAGGQMLAMVNASLDLYKLEQGTYAFKPGPVDLSRLLRKVAAQCKAIASAMQVEIRLQPAPEAATVLPTVRAEELLCYSLFANLLQNAIEASPARGTVAVSIEREATFACVSFLNQGEVPAPIRLRFFEKYVTSNKERGTGLGTYIAWLAVRAHAGRIELDADTPGQTTVRVWLPLADFKELEL